MSDWPTCAEQEGWGPWSPVCASEFTPCFEDVVLRLIPATFLFGAGIRRLVQLAQINIHSRATINWRVIVKNLAVFGLIGLSVHALATEFRLRLSGIAQLSVGLVEILALGFVFVVSYAEFIKTHRSSNVLLAFWPMLLATYAIKWRTLVLDCYGSDNEEMQMVNAKIGLTFVALVLECFGNETGIRLGEDDEVNKCPEDDANLFSISSFHWVTPLMKKGYASPLTMDDLWGLRKEDTSSSASDAFERAWHKELTKKNPSLVRAISNAFGRPFYIAGLWKMANDIFGFMQPILLGQLLRFVASYGEGKTPQPLYVGYTVSVLMLACSLSQTIVLHQYFHLCFRTGMHIRAGLVTTIYRKSLLLSNSARQSFTVGEIVNHMSLDAQRVQDLVSYLHVVWSGIFQITIALYLLYNTMGWAIFAGVAVMITMIPLNARLSVYMKNYQQQQMKNKDSRIKLMNEILNGIRVIKLYAWEKTFLQKVLTVRNDHELDMMKKIGYLSAVQSFTWACTPFLVSLSTFTVYAMVMKKPMTTDVVFVSISLFNLLQFPLAMFPSVISSTVEAYVAIGRVHRYLISDEVDPKAVIVEDYRKLSGRDAADKYMLLAKDATYSWSKGGAPSVHGINFALKKDCLLTVIGRVGSGKSSLLSAICGDLEHVNGEIRIRGSVAYVPQQPWIMNDTLRSNITFGNAFDAARYQATIEACCLQPDFDMLTGGDMCEIGERGINLSGGQKARISLARAVYANSDIYLFDDPLSAVDAHVGRTIFDKVIGPKGLLAGRCKVFVSHQIQYLNQSTNIMMLRDGSVVEQGTYTDLMRQQTEVYNLVREFGREEAEETGDSTDTDEQYHSLEPDVPENDTFPAEEANLLSTTPRSGGRRNSIRSTTSVRTLRRRQSTHDTGVFAGAAAADSAAAQAKAKDPNNGTNIISDETIKQGKVSRSVYMTYANACSMLSVVAYLLSMILSQGASIATSLWLTYWSSGTGDSNNSPLFYIGVYAALGITFSLLTVFQSIILLVFCAIKSARVLHSAMLHSVLRSPMMFFDTTPLGRILNRFSKDQSTIDEVLPRSFSSYSRTLFTVASVLLVVTYSTPSIMIVIVPFAIFYLWLQNYYLATSREIRRLDSVTRSPVFAHFQETLGGISTIRAYRQQGRFIGGNEHRLDENLRAFYPSISANRWLAWRLETISSVIIFGSAFLSVVSLSMNKKVDPGLVGLSLTYALSITQTLNWMVRQYTEIETNIVSVERIKEYIDLTPEAPETVDDNRPPSNWPSQGRVEFVDYETRYRPGLELVLKGVTFSVKPHEKIGICGRTGAGKSSLTLSLFRIIEAVEGQIFVDGMDIAKMGLYDVRSRFSIIPQDPVLFAGTVKFNLDPSGERSDQELWQALEDSHLKAYVSSLEGGLDAAVLEGGDNFSIGQRQLLALARALLRKTTILVLDEATAAVDVQTDQLVQAIIRQKFAYRTILTIAHRLNTIMDSDKILLLDKGRVAEFDSPANLLNDPTSMFYSLAKEAGTH